jgi:hypothetical protein
VQASFEFLIQFQYFSTTYSSPFSPKKLFASAMANPVTALRGPDKAHPRTLVFYINNGKRLALDQFIDDPDNGTFDFVKWKANDSDVYAPMLSPNNIQAI